MSFSIRNERDRIVYGYICMGKPGIEKQLHCVQTRVRYMRTLAFGGLDWTGLYNRWNAEQMGLVFFCMIYPRVGRKSFAWGERG